MSLKNLIFNHKKQRINLNCNILTGSFAQAIGLMFKSYRKARITCFPFQSARKISLTSCFCFFPILVLYVQNREIVDFKIIKPFKFDIPASFHADSIVEIPLKKREFENLKKISGLSPMAKTLSSLEKVKSSSGTKALNIS